MPTPADMRNAVLLSVATIAAGFVVPVFPFVGIPLGGFALGWIAYRFGSRSSIALALVATALVAVIGPIVLPGMLPLDALYVGVALLAAGPAAAWALRRYPAWNVVMFATFAATAAFLVTPFGVQLIKDNLAAAPQAFENLATSGLVSDPTFVRQNMGTLLTVTAAMLPAAVAYMTGLGMLLAIPLVSRLGRSLGVEVSRYPVLADVDLSFHLVWPAIAALALMAAGTFQGHAQGTVYVAGLSLLMIVFPVLVLQGFGLVAALYRRLGIGRIMRTLGYVLLVLSTWLLVFLAVLGLVDLFVNFRKIARGQATTTTDAVR
jgi:hypothetical protein